MFRVLRCTRARGLCLVITTSVQQKHLFYLLCAPYSHKKRSHTLDVFRKTLLLLTFQTRAHAATLPQTTEAEVWVPGDAAQVYTHVKHKTHITEFSRCRRPRCQCRGAFSVETAPQESALTPAPAAAEHWQKEH